MKRAILIILMISAVLSLAACNGEFRVTVTAGEGGSVTGGGVFNGGDLATVRAFPDDNAIFVGWYSGDDLVSGQSEYTFIVEGNLNLRAVFSKRAVLVLDSDLTEPYGAGEYVSGARVTVYTAVPEHYEFLGWYEGEALVSGDAEFSFVLDSDRRFEARFVAIRYGFSVESTDGGEVEGDFSGSCVFGDEVNLRAVSHEGFRFAGWFENGVFFSDKEEITYTVRGETRLLARFAKGYVLTVIAGEGITTNIDELTTYEGDDIRLEAALDGGYTFLGWRVGGRTVSADTVYEFVMPAADLTVYALCRDEFSGYTSVRTAEELSAIRNEPSGSYVLRRNIDLSDYEWTPICGGAVGFSGVLEGAGCVITGLSAEGDCGYIGGYKHTLELGLFGFVSGGEIRNLTIRASFDVTPDSAAFTTVYAGAFFGRAEALTASDLTAECAIRINSDGKLLYAGGIGGLVSEGSVLSDLKVEGSEIDCISGGAAFVGGIFGGLKASEMTGFSAESSVSARSGSGSGYVGGVVGYSCGLISRGDFVGNVKALSPEGVSPLYAGGIVGCANFTEVSGKVTFGSRGYAENCRSEGKVEAESGKRPVVSGGIIGAAIGAVKVLRSRSDGEITAASGGSYAYAGGIIGQTVFADGAMSVEGCVARGSVNSSGKASSGAETLVSVAGGIVGYAVSVSVKRSYSFADISAESSLGIVSAGGLLGAAVSYESSVLLEESYSAAGKISVSGAPIKVYAGGLVGYLRKGVKLSACFSHVYSYEVAISPADSFIGCFVGNLVGDSAESDYSENCAAYKLPEVSIKVGEDSLDLNENEGAALFDVLSVDFLESNLGWSETVWDFSAISQGGFPVLREAE